MHLWHKFYKFTVTSALTLSKQFLKISLKASIHNIFFTPYLFCALPLLQDVVYSLELLIEGRAINKSMLCQGRSPPTSLYIHHVHWPLHVSTSYKRIFKLLSTPSCRQKCWYKVITRWATYIVCVKLIKSTTEWNMATAMANLHTCKVYLQYTYVKIYKTPYYLMGY